MSRSAARRRTHTRITPPTNVVAYAQRVTSGPYQGPPASKAVFSARRPTASMYTSNAAAKSLARTLSENPPGTHAHPLQKGIVLANDVRTHPREGRRRERLGHSGLPFEEATATPPASGWPIEPTDREEKLA